MKIDNILNIGTETYKAESLNLFGEADNFAYQFVVNNKPLFQTKGKSIDDCRASLKSYLKKHTVCFTGHRTLLTDKISVFNHVLNEVQFTYRKGYRIFIAGGAVGFDMVAAEAVLKFKETHDDVILLIAVPFPEQNLRYSDIDKYRYNTILNRADFFIVLSATYHDSCYLHRNDFMLYNSSYLIAYWDGKPYGGTSYTCRRALAKKGLYFQNLL